jgi:signal peptidase I
MMWRKAVRFLIWAVVIVGVLIGIALIFLEPWRVPGDDAQFAVSIEPTMSPEDLVLVTRSTGTSDGALVRCIDPDAPGRFVVGRVVGSMGDKVEFSKGLMLVNGKLPSAPSACEPASVRLRNPATGEDADYGCALEEFAGSTHAVLRSSSNMNAARDTVTEVEAQKVFLASDNRVLHLDSRDFGTVQSASCQRIVFRLWGATGWGDTKKRITVFW